MGSDAAVARVWELAASVAAGEGMEVVDIEFRREGGRGGRVLRLYLDKEGGPNVDDLARVSRHLSELLDGEAQAHEGFAVGSTHYSQLKQEKCHNDGCSS